MICQTVSVSHNLPVCVQETDVYVCAFYVASGDADSDSTPSSLSSSYADHLGDFSTPVRKAKNSHGEYR